MGTRTLKKDAIGSGILILEETLDFHRFKGLPVYTIWFCEDQQSIGTEHYLDQAIANKAYSQRAVSPSPEKPVELHDGDAYKTVAISLESYVYGQGTLRPTEPPTQWANLVNKIISDTKPNEFEGMLFIKPTTYSKMVFAIAALSIMLRDRDAKPQSETT